jgi:hypothetical protein
VEQEQARREQEAKKKGKIYERRKDTEKTKAGS